MNIPNRLTVLRIILIPLMLLMMLPIGDGAWAAFTASGGLVIAFVLFLAASITDYFDGSMARKHHLVTTFGKLMDPIADKLLVISTFIAFVQLGRLHTLVPVMIMAREFLVTGLRIMAASRGEDIAAIWSGKLKTVTQMVALILLFLESILRTLTSWDMIVTIISYVGNLAVVLALFMTFYSGWEYVKGARAWIRTE